MRRLAAVPKQAWLSRCNFSKVPMGPPDPILGLGVAFNEDKSPNKVNLGVGVYRDDNNKPVVLDCVKRATFPQFDEMEYAPIAGIPAFVDKAQVLAFTDKGPRDRIASAQALSGTGALRVGASMLARFVENKTILVPDPTWPNHFNVFRDAGLNAQKYTYYQPATKGFNMEGMIKDLSAAAPGSIVLLHACAHNPTGVDPSEEQWKEIVSVINKKQLLPFVDMAYQGFASGDLDRDAFALRLVASSCENAVFAQSFAKNFSLYGQRVGAVHFLCKNSEEKERMLSQVKILIRPMYSNPPIHGARIVNAILSSPELTAVWKGELKAMADRMNGVRRQLVDSLKKEGSVHDWSHITKQIGMMAYTGLSKDQVARLKSEFHIYMTDDGRAAITGLNSKNVDYVAKSFHAISK